MPPRYRLAATLHFISSFTSGGHSYKPASKMTVSSAHRTYYTDQILCRFRTAMAHNSRHKSIPLKLVIIHKKFNNPFLLPPFLYYHSSTVSILFKSLNTSSLPVRVTCPTKPYWFNRPTNTLAVTDWTSSVRVLAFCPQDHHFQPDAWPTHPSMQ